MTSKKNYKNGANVVSHSHFQRLVQSRNPGSGEVGIGIGQVGIGIGTGIFGTISPGFGTPDPGFGSATLQK